MATFGLVTFISVFSQLMWISHSRHYSSNGAEYCNHALLFINVSERGSSWFPVLVRMYKIHFTCLNGNMEIVSYVEKDWTVSSLQATYRLPVFILHTLFSKLIEIFVCANKPRQPNICSNSRIIMFDYTFGWNHCFTKYGFIFCWKKVV